MIKPGNVTIVHQPENEYKYKIQNKNNKKFIIKWFVVYV